MQRLKLLQPILPTTTTPMTEPNQRQDMQPTCACVHHDAYECAWIRDGRPDLDDSDYHRRACECSCHNDEADEDEDDDL